MWAPSGMELIVILIVALLVFGPRKLPEIGKAVGSAVTEFKKGISGVTGEVNKVALKKMTDTIYHRGPDEEGFYFDGLVNLGVRRLSIIDIKTGQQPIHNEDKNIWIEAIAVEKGEGQDKVPNIEYGKAIDVPEKEMLLRLTAGLKEKYRKYLSYLKDKIVNQNDFFVIAIDRSHLEHMDAQIPLIFKCLFAIGHQVLFLKKGKPQPKTEGSIWSTREKVNKISGSEVEMLMFRDSSFEGISAVIYCDKNILNSPRNYNQMGSNFITVHNPFAKNPLSDKFFNFGDTWKQEGEQIKKI